MAFDWDEQIKQQVEAFNRKLMVTNPTLGYVGGGFLQDPSLAGLQRQGNAVTEQPQINARVIHPQGNVAGAGFPTAGSDFAKAGSGFASAGAGWKTADQNFRGFANAGLIPGEYNPEVADDVTINAKKGEYIFAPEVVQYYGTQKLEQMQMKAKEALGLPQETGPKMASEPDSLGRMDIPGLPQMQGLSDGGDLDEDKPVVPQDGATKSLGGIPAYLGANDSLPKVAHPVAVTPAAAPLASSLAIPKPPRPAGIQPYTPALVPESLREEQPATALTDTAATSTTNNNAGTGLIRFNDTGKQISMDSAGLTTADRGFADDVSPMLPASAVMDNLVNSQAEKLNNERYVEKMNRMGTEYTYGSDGKVIRISNVELTPENSINGKHISELMGGNPTPETRSKVAGLFVADKKQRDEAAVNASIIAERNANATLNLARAAEQGKLADAAAKRAENISQGKHYSGARAPMGYQYKADGTLMPIEGGPADMKIRDRAKQQEGRLQSINSAVSELESLINHPGRGAATGFIRTSIIPGTDAASFAAKLDTFKSKMFVPVVEQMKGMGQLSDAEGKRLVESVGALDTKMGEEAFLSSMGNILEELLQKRSLSEKYMDTPQPGLPQGGRQASPTSNIAPAGTQAKVGGKILTSDGRGGWL